MMEKHNDLARDREYQRRYAMLLATAWRDEGFMQRLQRDPVECFAEFGITVPNDKRLMVHVETPEELHVVIPQRPPEFDEAIKMETADNCWKSSKCWNLCD